MHYNSFRTVGNGALVLSRVVATRPLVLGGITGYNNKGSDLFIQIHEAAALPANATVPMYSFRAFANSVFSFALPVGVDLSSCTVVASTTVDSLTVDTGTPIAVQAQIQGGSV
jgi:hypothetical protein